MSSPTPRPVGWWLLLVALAVLVQVGLGGITRLTDSGLSITEWKPILGVVPPTNEAGWLEAFAKYQQIPQYTQLKSHLTLDEFKFIYFWEWFHRLWGRLLGFFFAVPFVVFWRRGWLKGREKQLIALFVLGGAQGALGWFMVASGLSDLVYVSHFRLAAHFMLAMFLLAALAWTGLQILRPDQNAAPRSLRNETIGFVVFLAVQMTWGAFMAGLKAALAAPTWPTINGLWVPRTLLEEWPWQDPLSVHFVHRTLGVVIALGLVRWWFKTKDRLGLERHLVVGMVLVQFALGVFTVLFGAEKDAFLWLGLSHQLVGSCLLVSLVAALQRLRAVE